MTAPRLDALDAIERACWQGLADAAHDAGHDWHVLALATRTGDGADARSVVLREVDAAARTLVFYTDARSPKVTQFAAHPRATLLAWSARRGWQLRLAVTLALEDDGLAVSSRWARVQLSPAANDYLAALPPGTPVAGFVPERASRTHFAVVVATVRAIDWLELHADGHRRARFGGAGVDGPTGWLTP